MDVIPLPAAREEAIRRGKLSIFLFDAAPVPDDAQLQEHILRILLPRACASFAQQNYHGTVKSERFCLGKEIKSPGAHELTS